MGARCDQGGGVTGVGVGVNRKSVFAQWSAVNASGDWKGPVEGEAGWGTGLHAGGRDLPWHLAGSLMLGGNERLSQRMVGASWAVDLAPLGWFPLSYFGEYDLNRATAMGGAPLTGLVSVHEYNYLVHDGLNVKSPLALPTISLIHH